MTQKKLALHVYNVTSTTKDLSSLIFIINQFLVHPFLSFQFQSNYFLLVCSLSAVFSVIFYHTLACVPFLWSSPLIHIHWSSPWISPLPTFRKIFSFPTSWSFYQQFIIILPTPHRIPSDCFYCLQAVHLFNLSPHQTL